MAKASDASNSPEIPANVETKTARDGTLIPVNSGMSGMSELTDDILRGIGQSGDAFADAMAVAQAIHGTVESLTAEFGSGFSLLNDKAQLVGKRFVMLKWTFTDGDFGVFASAVVVTVDGGRYIVNDGSTGMCNQLREFSMRTGRYGGYVADNGLRASNYATCKGCGQPRHALDDVCEARLKNGSVCGDTDTARGTGATYYLDLSA